MLLIFSLLGVNDQTEMTKGKHQRGIFFSLFYSKLRAQIPQKYVKDHTRELMFVEG